MFSEIRIIEISVFVSLLAKVVSIFWKNSIIISLIYLFILSILVFELFCQWFTWEGYKKFNKEEWVHKALGVVASVLLGCSVHRNIKECNTSAVGQWD